MQTAGIFAASLVVALSGALVPGPLLMVTGARAAVRGFAAAPRIVLGHALLELAVVVALLHGLQPALRREGLRAAIGLAGGAMLLWMGLGVALAVRRGKMRLSLDGDLPAARGGAAGDVLAGILASAANPYWVLWWATAGASLCLLALKQGVPGLVAFYTGHVAGDLAWYALVGLLVVAGRRTLNQRVYRGFLLACSLLLMALGAWFAVGGLLLIGG